VALKLIDSLRPRPRGVVVVAGPVYGGNTLFLAGLASRDIDFVVEVRPSDRLHLRNGDSRSRLRAAAGLLSAAKWKHIKVRAPGAPAALDYRVARLAEVRLPSNKTGDLFAGQTGGILGIHRGTILGISSKPGLDAEDLLRVVGWARWIRPTTRRQERRSLLAGAHTKGSQPTSRRRTGTPLPVRANIDLSRRQDEQAARLHEGFRKDATPWRGVLDSESPALNVIDLFAGAGCMGLGFLLAGDRKRHFRIVFSGEVNPIYAETLRRNHDALARQRARWSEDSVPLDTEATDLRSADAIRLVRRSARAVGGVHVLIGGPPCQGFSNANRNSWHSTNPNNRLIDVFLRYVEVLRPPVFLLENVQGILWTPKGGRSSERYTVVDHLRRRMAAAGYDLFPKLLDAVWYGVPQYRSRFFLLGLRHDLGYRGDDFGAWGPFPFPTHGPGCSQPYVTVEEAIGDLPPIRNGELRMTQHYHEPSSLNVHATPFLSYVRAGAKPGVILDHVTSRHAPYVLERYRRIPEGGNWRDIVGALTNYTDVERTHSNIYRRLRWAEPSVTIGHYRKSMLIHPSQQRGLSLREASRLQSLPDWFRFAGRADGKSNGLVHKQQQLANAVCPLVAMALADFILKL